MMSSVKGTGMAKKTSEKSVRSSSPTSNLELPDIHSSHSSSSNGKSGGGGGGSFDALSSFSTHGRVHLDGPTANNDGGDENEGKDPDGAGAEAHWDAVRDSIIVTEADIADELRLRNVAADNLADEVGLHQISPLLTRRPVPNQKCHKNTEKNT
jgi:hypothetical protein